MKYVCGFAQASTPEFENRVLLIKKERPDWQLGLWNGIGGKIETGEGIRKAMQRKFLEETGIETEVTDWQSFHYERFRSGDEVWFMHTQAVAFSEFEHVSIRSMRGELTDEQISHVKVSPYTGLPMLSDLFPMVYNLRYLLAMSHATLATLPAERPLEC